MANQALQNRNARNQLVQNQPIRSQTTPNRLRWWSWTDLRIRQHRILVERHYPMPEGGPAHAKGTIEVESRQTGRIIRVNWYCGMDNTNAAAPVIIHLSGRNFCVKSHGIDDEFLHIVARENSPFIVLDVEYRIAPEYPYPAALEDIQDVLQYLRRHPADYDLNHLAICGFGAGGNLALAMALSSPRDTFETAVVFYPVTDLSYPEKRKIQLMEPDIRRRMRRGTGGVMPPWVMESTIQSYLRGNHPNIVDDPRLSPIRQQDEGRFPRRLLFITAEGDPWTADTKTMVDGLIYARRRDPTSLPTVFYLEMLGVGHAWDKYRKLDDHGLNQKNTAYDTAARFLRREVHP
ncbi:hypothetical protein ASPFODRAFT_59309 [Aspergillus luchuensis CBS 106.47]|uniref:Alpha/beta hydrolase fold-3 domain-containing protein n=1 Tax=Aspergillus luchuensis (strain CBS 106.47) TaxID=1137211 RepID=A0A1M3TPG5_ASPLC|nr:hypothetical protein ASPFODRAFT_59309 [Aspergillus luchuensis CBS 106.47]